jgi:outer membrane immunogenic protein
VRVINPVAVISIVLGLFASSQPALAQDTPVTWTGGYLGVHGGWLSGSSPEFPSSSTQTNKAVTSDEQNHASTFIGGVHAGYNRVHEGVYIYGIEGDIDWTHAEGGGSSSAFFHNSYDDCSEGEPICHVDYTVLDQVTLRSHLNWLASLRGRAGVLIVDNLMLYFTAGIAFTEVKVRATNSQTFNQTVTYFAGCEFDCTQVSGYHDVFSASDSKTLVGYVLGFGSELKFDQNWSGRIEYLFYDFGSQTFNLSGDFNSRIETDIHENVFRVGLSYYLN